MDMNMGHHHDQSQQQLLQQQQQQQQQQTSQQQQSLILRASCDSCSKAKVRCDRAKPCCQRCQQRDIKCHYGFSQRSGRKRRLRTLDETNAPADGVRKHHPSISSSSTSSSSASSPDLRLSAARPFALSPSNAFLSSEHMSSAFSQPAMEDPSIADDFNFWDPWNNTSLYTETPALDLGLNTKPMPLMLNTAFDDPMISEQQPLEISHFEAQPIMQPAPTAYMQSPTVYSSIEPSTVSPASLRRPSPSPSPEKDTVDDKLAALTTSMKTMQKQMEDLSRQRESCPATCGALLNVLVDLQQNDMSQTRCKEAFSHSHSSGDTRLRQSVSELHHELLRLKDGMESIKQQHWLARH